ncbi:MAG: ATP-binding cassette domain-containing protein [Verrucomicrobiia bacterium]
MVSMVNGSSLPATPVYPMISSGAPLISANELALTYGHQPLLVSVTLGVAPGEKLGLVGRNGSGKTSLLRILSGQQAPDRGEVYRRRGLRVGYLPQEFELSNEQTVRENIEQGAADLLDWLTRYEGGEGSDAELAEVHNRIEAADGWNFQARIKALASALGAPPLDAIAGPLSGGEKRRVALCRALAGGRTCCCWTNRRTTLMPSRSSGWKISCGSSRAPSSS